jgi:hypothetical protein
LADFIAFWLCAAFFGDWVLGSLLILVPRCAETLRLYDVLALLPEWKFFAPNPARGDFHLLYRDRLPSGLGPFTEIRFLEPRPWWACFWNPQRRSGKALFDAVIGLAHQSKSTPGAVATSTPYLTLLQYISMLPRYNAGTHTQFLVLYSGAMKADQGPQLVYVSPLHEL